MSNEANELTEIATLLQAAAWESVREYLKI